MSDQKRNIPLIRLAYRNIRRNTRRTMLTASAVAVAVLAIIFMIAYIHGALNNVRDTYARTESGHVRIRAEGYAARERFMPVHLNVSNVSDKLEMLRAREGVKDVLPRIRTSVLVDGGESNRPGLLLGIDMEREEGYFSPRESLLEGRLPGEGEPEVLIGRRFAEKLEVGVGDELVLLGQTSFRSLGGLGVTVSGIVTTGLGALDARVIFAPLDQARILHDLNDGATELLVFSEDPETADSLAADLSTLLEAQAGKDYEVRSWRDQGPLIRLMESAQGIYGIVYFILLLMAGLIIVNTMLMTVLERTREFGMLSALGMRRTDVVMLVITEGFLIGIFGALIGFGIGSGLALWIESVGINVEAAVASTDLPFQGRIYTDWKWLSALGGATLGIVTAGFASLYPALRAVRKPAAEALRHT